MFLTLWLQAATRGDERDVFLACLVIWPIGAVMGLVFLLKVVFYEWPIQILKRFSEWLDSRKKSESFNQGCAECAARKKTQEANDSGYRGEYL